MRNEKRARAREQRKKGEREQKRREREKPLPDKDCRGRSFIVSLDSQSVHGIHSGVESTQLGS